VEVDGVTIFVIHDSSILRYRHTRPDIFTRVCFGELRMLQRTQNLFQLFVERERSDFQTSFTIKKKNISSSTYMLNDFKYSSLLFVN